MKRILRAILSMTLVLVLGFGVIAGLTQIFETDEPEVASQDTQQQVADDLAFTEPLTAEDCLPSELFDSEAGECYYECDSESECEAIQAQLDIELEQLYEDSSVTKERSDTPANSSFTQYTVSGTTLVPTDKDGEVADIDAEVWALFTKIAPSSFITENIARYSTYQDDSDDTSAYVDPMPNEPNNWSLVVNVAATHEDGTFLRDETARTLIHEFAHVLTLDDAQVTPAEWDQINPEQCEQFYTGEGCALVDSYINEFYSRFWADIFDELPEEGSDEAATFFTEYMDRFLNDYAATNPGEDIAESFTAFVLKSRPAVDGPISDQKVAFFYDFSELVSLRQEIRERIK